MVTDDDIAFFMERLQWYDFVTDENIKAFDDWGWAVVDHEVLLARSALEFLRDRLPDAALAMIAAADAQFRAHPQAFAHMFRRAIGSIDAKAALAGWVDDDDGKPVPIPPSHWWWQLPKDW
ncbi:hypothetical protein GWK36_11050 [Caldichromatium japonicum]|uniref:Uncharacterized protein n=1 Tax=Caldichromatium japonicum TaxID=2699430 RepID=A0A6G7VEX8_9GAMM|nr:hypothetical protein [Caldichromatium japonicum]QIK38426.1 hypothetical protein GWK36_11050 [Caldichromatium japonicum]